MPRAQRPYTFCWSGFKSAVCQPQSQRFFQTVQLSQRPYRLSCWGFKSAVCGPSNGSTLRSGPRQHCLVQTAQPSAAALHTVLLKAQDFKPPQCSAATLHTVLFTLQGYRLRASQPLTHCLVGAAKVPAFKPLNAPQRPYTVFCWSFYSRLPVSNLQRRQPSAAAWHSIVEALRRLPAFRGVLSAAALHILSLGFTSAVCQPSDLSSNR